LPTRLPGWPPHKLCRESCMLDPSPAFAAKHEIGGAGKWRSSPLPASFCPSLRLGSINFSHQIQNVENDPPQGLAQSNPPSLYPGGFRCGSAHFRMARKPSADHASVQRVSRKRPGQVDARPVPSRHFVGCGRAFCLDTTSPLWAGRQPENSRVPSAIPAGLC
jgi:hypothetical protein